MALGVADSLSRALSLPVPSRAAVLLAAPKTLQTLIAALGDYYTYKLAQHVYGRNSYPAWCTLFLTAASPWNWFVSTRTFSNCAETTLTIIALYNWPYHWALGADEVGFQLDDQTLRIRQTEAITPSKEKAVVTIDESTRLRRALLAAAIAVILRPTNAIIWLTLTLATFGRGIYHHGVHWEIGAFIRDGLLCGSVVLLLSALVDRVFYGVWAFPLWQFFKFNVLQSLAVFYGNNDWHYYLSQGYPLLLMFAIIPAIMGLWTVLFQPQNLNFISIQSKLILHRLALVCLTLPAVLSILSHKEVRFIYPILPALHIIAAPILARMFGLPEVIGKASMHSTQNPKISTSLYFGILFVMNASIAGYFSFYHNSGLIAATDYLRNEFETRYIATSTSIYQPEPPKAGTNQNLTLAVLMPCHSIPWRSHLQYPPTASEIGISGWALTCEPPLNLTPEEKQSYEDEADIFYNNPSLWFKHNIAYNMPKGKLPPGVYAPDPADSKKLWSDPNPKIGRWLNEGEGGRPSELVGSKKRAWPDYFLFFGQLELTMTRIMAGSAYVECKRFHNSLFHDDWRRKGDVVVWCLPERGNTKDGEVKQAARRRDEL